MDKYTESFYPESYFGGFTQADGTVAFYSRVNALIEPSFVLVDFGCGRGQHAEDEVSTHRRLQCFKGRVAKVIGLDVDSAGQTNPTIDEFCKLAPDQIGLSKTSLPTLFSAIRYWSIWLRRSSFSSRRAGCWSTAVICASVPRTF
jgi:hypothetical protein